MYFCSFLVFLCLICCPFVSASWNFISLENKDSPDGKITFQVGDDMGDSDERPAHQVTLSPFEIMDTLVTQENYVSLTQLSNPSLHNKPDYCPVSFREIVLSEGKTTQVCPDLPVENITFLDVDAFVRLVNERKSRDDGYKYDLPTEAQLEYAYRGEVYTQFISGDIGDYRWYNPQHKTPREDSYSDDYGQSAVRICKSQPVKSKKPNDYGFYYGSLFELAKDHYQIGYYWNGTYDRGITLDSFYERPESSGLDPVSNHGDCRATRGSSVYSSIRACRSSARSCTDGTSKHWGFRLVRVKNAS